MMQAPRFARPVLPAQSNTDQTSVNQLAEDQLDLPGLEQPQQAALAICGERWLQTGTPFCDEEDA